MSPFKLRFNSPRHNRIRDAIIARKKTSQDKMSEKYPFFRRMEELFQAVIPETENDRIRRGQREAGKPKYTTLVVPYSYAVLLTAHTYWTTVFLGRSPVFQYQGRHGEPSTQVKAVEALMDYQLMVGGQLVPLYIWLLDAGKYGLGVLGTYWEEEELTVSRFEEKQETFVGIPIGPKKRVKITEKIKGYEGNRAYNVRPFDFYPDPRVPVNRLQEGEFVGRKVNVGWNKIVQRGERGLYFNIDVLKKLKPNRGESRDIGSPAISLPEDSELTTPMDIQDMGYFELLEMYIELIPRDWELGSGTSPEKWVFTVANEQVIIGAQPLGEYHNRFPFDILEYEPEGYGFLKRSMLEVSEPMNDSLTWLVNTHFFNVRKALNDTLIVDPSKIVMKDLTDPNAGRIIRLKPTAYGMDPRMAVTQLTIVDVTQNHLRDTQVFTDMIQRSLGVTDNIMGMLNSGGRKTATEIRTSSSFGVNRLKNNAEYMSAMGFTPLSQRMLQTTQQFYDLERRYRIAGDTLIQGDPFVNVTPETIQGFFDFVPVDGTMPIDRFAQANLWKEMFVQMVQSPQLAQQYDVSGVFTYMAKLGGLTAIDQFRLQLTDTQKLIAQIKAGNFVPLEESDVGKPNGGGEGFSAPPGATSGEVEGPAERSTFPKPISGMGPVG